MIRHSILKANLLFLLAGCTLFAASVSGVCEDLYIINSGFEKTSVFRKTPQGWKTWVREGHDTEVTFDVDARIAYQGTRSVKIINLGYADCCYCLRRNIPICAEGNFLYQVGGYIRCQKVEGTATIKVFTVDENGRKDWKAALATTAGSHGWRFLSERFAVASTVVELGLQLELVGPGTAWFDQLSLRRIETDSLSTITRGKKTFLEMPLLGYGERLSLSGVQDTRDFLLFLAPNPGDVVPDAVPVRQEIASTVEISAARDEYQPAIFNIYALKDLDGIRIQVTDLVDSQGRIITADAIDVRVVRYWPQRFSWDSGSYRVIPELLEQRQEVDIPERKSQQFWLTVYIPPGTVPGTYRSIVNIAARNADSFDMALNVHVWPFELKSPLGTVWGLYADDRRWERYTLEQVRAELEDIRSHGINSLLISPLSMDRMTMGQDGIEIDLSRVDAYIKAMQEVGFSGQLVFSLQNLDALLSRLLREKGDKRDFAGEYRNIVKQLKASAEENDWPQIWYLAVDEPANSEEKRARAIEWYRLLKEMGCGTFTTADAVFCDQVLDPWLDVRCYHIGSTGKTADQLAKRKAETADAGDIFWWYGSGCYPGQEGNLSENRYLTGFLFWKTGAGGQWSWTYQRPSGDPYDDFDGIGKDACITYPAEGGGGSIPTLQWEGLREGIDDARYVYTLETLIQKKLNSPDSRAREKAMDARRQLKALMDTVPWLYEDALSNAAADDMRRKITEMILELDS
jgi:hypothetical protein